MFAPRVVGVLMRHNNTKLIIKAISQHVWEIAITKTLDRKKE